MSVSSYLGGEITKKSKKIIPTKVKRAVTPGEGGRWSESQEEGQAGSFWGAGSIFCLAFVFPTAHRIIVYVHQCSVRLSVYAL